MVTKEEWDELDKKIDGWAKWRLEQAAKRAKAAAEKVQDDARVDPADMQRPTTNFNTRR